MSNNFIDRLRKSLKNCEKLQLNDIGNFNYIFDCDNINIKKTQDKKFNFVTIQFSNLFNELKIHDVKKNNVTNKLFNSLLNIFAVEFGQNIIGGLLEKEYIKLYIRST
jgi:hypothetical protein